MTKYVVGSKRHVSNKSAISLEQRTLDLERSAFLRDAGTCWDIKPKNPIKEKTGTLVRKNGCCPVCNRQIETAHLCPACGGTGKSKNKNLSWYRDPCSTCGGRGVK